MAPYRAILRYYRCDTPYHDIARYSFREASAPPKWCETPPWYLAPAIPHFAMYRAIIVQYPPKKARKRFAILSLQVSHDVKSISIAAGALSFSAVCYAIFWRFLCETCSKTCDFALRKRSEFSAVAFFWETGTLSATSHSLSKEDQIVQQLLASTMPVHSRGCFVVPLSRSPHI